MSIFNESGHLSGTALQKLIDFELSDSCALAVAEHLADCDICTAKYAKLLESCELLCPSEPLAGHVMYGVATAQKRERFNRFVKLAVAACLVFALWFGGVFTVMLPKMIQRPNKPSTSQTLVSQVTQKLNEMIHWYDTQGDDNYEKK